jgi:hypothetical protein
VHSADAACAVLIAEGAARAAVLLVRVNLASRPEDPRVTRAETLARNAAAAVRRALEASS